MTKKYTADTSTVIWDGDYTEHSQNDIYNADSDNVPLRDHADKVQWLFEQLPFVYVWHTDPTLATGLGGLGVSLTAIEKYKALWVKTQKRTDDSGNRADRKELYFWDGVINTQAAVIGTQSGATFDTSVNDTVKIGIDKTGIQTIVLTSGAATPIATVISDINTALGATIASNDGSDHVKLESTIAGITSSIEIGDGNANPVLGYTDDTFYTGVTGWKLFDRAEIGSGVRHRYSSFLRVPTAATLVSGDYVYNLTPGADVGVLVFKTGFVGEEETTTKVYLTDNGASGGTKYTGNTTIKNIIAAMAVNIDYSGGIPEFTTHKDKYGLDTFYQYKEDNSGIDRHLGLFSRVPTHKNEDDGSLKIPYITIDTSPSLPPGEASLHGDFGYSADITEQGADIPVKQNDLFLSYYKRVDLTNDENLLANAGFYILRNDNNSVGGWVDLISYLNMRTVPNVTAPAFQDSIPFFDDWDSDMHDLWGEFIGAAWRLKNVTEGNNVFARVPVWLKKRSAGTTMADLYIANRSATGTWRNSGAADTQITQNSDGTWTFRFDKFGTWTSLTPRGYLYIYKNSGSNEHEVIWFTEVSEDANYTYFTVPATGRGLANSLTTIVTGTDVYWKYMAIGSIRFTIENDSDTPVYIVAVQNPENQYEKSGNNITAIGAAYWPEFNDNYFSTFQLGGHYTNAYIAATADTQAVVAIPGAGRIVYNPLIPSPKQTMYPTANFDSWNTGSYISNDPGSIDPTQVFWMPTTGDSLAFLSPTEVVLGFQETQFGDLASVIIACEDVTVLKNARLVMDIYSRNIDLGTVGAGLKLPTVWLMGSHTLHQWGHSGDALVMSLGGFDNSPQGYNSDNSVTF